MKYKKCVVGKKHQAKKICITIGMVAASVLNPLHSSAANDALEYNLEIPAQNASSSLLALGKKTGLSILVKHSARQVKLNGLNGQYSIEQALSKLLDGTELKYQINKDSIVVGLSNPKKTILGVVFGSMLASLGTNVTAQQEATDVSEQQSMNTLEEVIVTSTKRGKQSLQDIPATIQAIGDDVLTQANINQFEDYAFLVPGLSFEDNGPGDKKYVLRGVRSVGASTTGVYFDEMVITGTNRHDGGGQQPDLQLVDMKQIDVLKGPQGTLYGASSMSGTIRMIPNAPNLEEAEYIVGGELSTVSHGGANYHADAVVNLPVLENKAAFRLVAYHRDNSGYLDNLFLQKKDANDQQISGGRLSFKADISDDVSLSLMAIYQNMETGGSSYRHPKFSEFGHLDYHNGRWEEDTHAYSATLDWDLGHGVVTANSSLFDRDVLYISDAAWILSSFLDDVGPDQILSELGQPQSREIWSNEIRYNSAWDSKFSLVTGIYYQREKSAFRSTVYGLDGDLQPLATPFIYLDREVSELQKQNALFGELSYQLTERLSATIGLRWFDIQSKQNSQDIAEFTFNGKGASSPEVYTNSDEDGVTTKFNLSYHHSDDMLLYVNVAEGFRTGGTNEPGVGGEMPPPGYNSDSLTNYELGIKSDWLAGRLRLNAALYYIDWNDIQVKNRIDNTGYLDNAGKAHIAGSEIELNAYLSDPWSIGAGLTLLEAQLDDDEPIGAGTSRGLDGDRITNVPEVTWNLYLENKKEMPEFDATRTLRIDTAYIGESFSEFRPDIEGYNKVGDYYTVNASYGLQSDSWQVVLFAKNIFDDVATRSVNFSNRRPLIELITRPRTIGVSFGYQF